MRRVNHWRCDFGCVSALLDQTSLCILQHSPNSEDDSVSCMLTYCKRERITRRSRLSVTAGEGNRRGGSCESTNQAPANRASHGKRNKNGTQVIDYLGSRLRNAAKKQTSGGSCWTVAEETQRPQQINTWNETSPPPHRCRK